MARADKKVRIFSALEVANICGVVNQTAINWIKNGYLKAFTTPGGQYRVYAEDLVHFLHSRGMRVPEELHRVLEDEMAIMELLVIDDDRDLNEAVAGFLRDAYPQKRVHQAFDGFEAGRVIGEVKPDVIILDIDLPGVDGYSLCTSIKSDQSLGNPIIIAVSGLDASEAEDKIKEAGAHAFLSKPIDMNEIPELIKQFAKNR